jgi:hypothetical protein
MVRLLWFHSMSPCFLRDDNDDDDDDDDDADDDMMLMLMVCVAVVVVVVVVVVQLRLGSDSGLLLSLFVAGGVGVWLGSVVSPRVDMVLFRRLLILLLLLGANVMLLTGVVPVTLALGGALALLGGVALYATALYHEPQPPPPPTNGIMMPPNKPLQQAQAQAAGGAWLQDLLGLWGVGWEGWGGASSRASKGGPRYAPLSTTADDEEELQEGGKEMYAMKQLDDDTHSRSSSGRTTQRIDV